MNRLPHLIGLCGHPKAGKSEVQRLLQELFEVAPVDDGLALRSFSVAHLGLTWDDVATQAGKQRNTKILDRDWQNREILGELGKKLEDLFGDHVMPFMATRNLDPSKSYSFGSVRKTQGQFYRKQGGVIIGVRNPQAEPSPYAFDKFDEELVDYWIENDAQARGMSDSEAMADLEGKVLVAIGFLLNRPSMAA